MVVHLLDKVAMVDKVGDFSLAVQTHFLLEVEVVVVIITHHPETVQVEMVVVVEA